MPEFYRNVVDRSRSGRVDGSCHPGSTSALALAIDLDLPAINQF